MSLTNERMISELGHFIKIQRLQKKLTQTQLSQISGVSLNLISQIESGKIRVQFIKLLQVLRALGIQLKVGMGATPIVWDQNKSAKGSNRS